jgi:cell wall assembly regulator SMI1
MNKVWGRIESWLRTNAPPVFDSFQVAVTESQISETETFLGIQFPDSVKNFFSLHNGQKQNSIGGYVYGHRFMSIEQIKFEWEMFKSVFDKREFDGIDVESDSGIQHTIWNPKWIPLTTDGKGSYDVLDLDPTEQGKSGQIIHMLAKGDKRILMAESFELWLKQFAETLESGDFIYIENQGIYDKYAFI